MKKKLKSFSSNHVGIKGYQGQYIIPSSLPSASIVSNSITNIHNTKQYRFVCSDLEGIVWILNLTSDKLYTQEEFEKICFKILKDFYKNEENKDIYDGYGAILERFNDEGFKEYKEDIQGSFTFCPHVEDFSEEDSELQKLIDDYYNKEI